MKCVSFDCPKLCFWANGLDMILSIHFRQPETYHCAQVLAAQKLLSVKLCYWAGGAPCYQQLQCSGEPSTSKYHLLLLFLKVQAGMLLT
jgi:hypothetical protein